MSGVFPLEEWRRLGDSPAVAEGARTWSYAELAREVERMAAGFRSELRAGTVVGLEAEYSAEAIFCFLALAEAGAAIALVSPFDPRRHECLAAAACERVYRQSGAKLSPEEGPGGPAPALLEKLGGSPGLVVFTSGSGGAPKAALHDLTRLAHRHNGGRQAMRTALFLEMDHLGGVNTLLYCLLRGGCAWIPPSRDPAAFFPAADRDGVELLPLTPSYIGLFFLSGLQEKLRLARVKTVSYGAEVMPEPILRRFHALYPHIRLVQVYGSTEFAMLPAEPEGGSSTWLRFREANGYATKVENGFLYVKAPTSMLGYLNHPSPMLDGGWMATGDRVETRDGFLRILGREGDFVNVGGRKVSPAAVEEALLAVPNVGEAVVFGVPNELLGQVVAAKVVARERPADEEAFVLALQSACAEKLAPHEVPVTIELCQAITYSPRWKKERS